MIRPQRVRIIGVRSGEARATVGAGVISARRSLRYGPAFRYFGENYSSAWGRFFQLQLAESPRHDAQQSRACISAPIRMEAALRVSL